ncbi:hypothetical protein PIROE2DRAFT_4575 [Piromyces sp. E2]|nr:hypothetical protein PIROE2DRAFT_4575 [Piromyces sp. E2]|eukprot:OUM67895.1 hypothetical protein PIROE2DRAFT_4575 [Piromyces sp. E2]
MIFPKEIIIKICEESKNAWLYLLSGYCNLTDLKKMNFFPKSRFYMQDILSLKQYKLYIKLLLVINKYCEELKFNFKCLENQTEQEENDIASNNWKTVENEKSKICLDTFYIKNLYTESQNNTIYSKVHDCYFKVIHTYVYQLGYTKEFLEYAQLHIEKSDQLYKYNINYYGTYTNIDYYTFNYGKPIGSSTFDNKIHNLNAFFNVNADNVISKNEQYIMDGYENSFELINTNKNKYYISDHFEVPFIIINKNYLRQPDNFIINYANQFVQFEISQSMKSNNPQHKKPKLYKKDISNNDININNNNNNDDDDDDDIANNKNNKNIKDINHHSLYCFKNINIRTIILSFFNIRNKENLLYLDKILALRNKYRLDIIDIHIDYTQLNDESHTYFNNLFLIDNPKAYTLYDDIYNICMRHGYIKTILNSKSLYFFKQNNLLQIYDSKYDTLLTNIYNSNINYFFSYVDFNKETQFIPLHIHYTQFEIYIDFLYYLLKIYDKRLDHSYQDIIIEKENTPVSFDDTIEKNINEIYQNRQLILSKLNQWKERYLKIDHTCSPDLCLCYEIFDCFENTDEVEHWKSIISIISDNLYVKY